MPIVVVGRQVAARFWFSSLLLLSFGCTEIQRDVEVTPDTVPEKIQDARWQSLPVNYCVVPEDSGFVGHERLAELVDEAFRRWDVETVSDGECDEVAQGNGRNEVAWGLPEAAQTEPPHEGVYPLGFTRQLFRSCPAGCEGGTDSQIVEADILLEPAPPDQFRNEECLFSTLLHETGHFLGVPHLESPALMAPATTGCPQELTEADREALARLYDEEPESL